MATNIQNLRDAYVPSDDGMSDILHNAGHAYVMCLDDKEDTEMSLDHGQLVSPLRKVLT